MTFQAQWLFPLSCPKGNNRAFKWEHGHIGQWRRCRCRAWLGELVDRAKRKARWRRGGRARDWYCNIHGASQDEVEVQDEEERKSRGKGGRRKGGRRKDGRRYGGKEGKEESRAVVRSDHP